MNQDRKAVKTIYIVAPGGGVGGGMGRVKDYILQSDAARNGPVRFEALVTRDERGAAFSLLLLLRAILTIWWARLNGSLAFVHVNFGDRGSAFRKGVIILASALVGAPTLLHLHAAELVEFHAEGSAIRRWLLRLPFRQASAIIVLGRLWKEWLVRDLGIDAGKIDILCNGVPVVPMPRTFAAEPGRTRTILFLGLLTERKGISDFLAALALLPGDAPPWRAIIAGHGDVARYTALAEELGLAGRAEFTGWVGQADVRRLLGSVDMMVLPSYHEGLPLVILEALGCGAPVITTPVGAIPEFLEQGREVLLVPPGDRRTLAERMLDVMTDPVLQQSLSDNGLERFRARFTLEAFLADMLSIYARRFGVRAAPSGEIAAERAR
ncbi:MAG: glycosyltransferase family 4 protein [Beijerinckiaceae bacterium]|nr:glycosyltransferase family 4 protein [Beijerinckiaceae bacterium]MCZ8299112.1 glycosyltransferase family 4 protein [Beijerinckiaceae bacterium]